MRKVGEECGCPNERKGKCVGEKREGEKKRGIGVTRKGRKEGWKRSRYFFGGGNKWQKVRSSEERGREERGGRGTMEWS